MLETSPDHAGPDTLWHAAVEACFYGHLFYGLCAVAQVTETSVQLALPANGWLLACAFIGTVVFYSYPYTRRSANGADPRVAWHRRNAQLVLHVQRWALVALVVLGGWFVMQHRDAIVAMTAIDWMVLAMFPAAGALYYGAPLVSRTLTLRQASVLKPFVIGFVWAGVVVAYPVLFARLQFGHYTPLALFPVLLFIKTLMFVAVLAILFDIKDRDIDERLGLSTVVTLVGTERALFQVSLPLTILGVATFLSYATMQHLTLPRVLLVLSPFVLLVAAIVSLTRPRSILYYLVVIDGLMLAKALLDIAAMRF